MTLSEGFKVLSSRAIILLVSIQNPANNNLMSQNIIRLIVFISPLKQSSS